MRVPTAVASVCVYPMRQEYMAQQEVPNCAPVMAGQPAVLVTQIGADNADSKARKGAAKRTIGTSAKLSRLFRRSGADEMP